MLAQLLLCGSPAIRSRRKSRRLTAQHRKTKPCRPERVVSRCGKKGTKLRTAPPHPCHQGDTDRPRLDADRHRVVAAPIVIGPVADAQRNQSTLGAGLSGRARSFRHPVLGALRGRSYAFIRVHSLDVRSLELAVGRRLWCEQRRVRSADPQFSRSTRFGVSMGADGSGPDLTLNRIEFTVNRIAGASDDRQRAKNYREGRKL